MFPESAAHQRCYQWGRDGAGQTEQQMQAGCPTFAPAYVGRKRWAKPHNCFCNRDVESQSWVPVRLCRFSTVPGPPKAHIPSELGRNQDQLSGTLWQRCQAAASAKQRPACRRIWRPYAPPVGKPCRVYPPGTACFHTHEVQAEKRNAQVEQYSVYS